VTGIPLFHDESLGDWLTERVVTLQNAIATADDSFLADSHPDDLTRHFRDMGRLDPIAIERTGISVISSSTTTSTGRRRLTIRFAVPFTGPSRLFRMRPKSYKTSPPVAASIGDSILEFSVETDLDAPGNAETQLGAILDQIENPYLVAIREQVDEHNRHVDRIAEQELAAAREQIFQAREIVKALPFPLHRRADADVHAVPIIRRSIRAHVPPNQSAFQPDPALDEADYESVLEVLHSMRTMIERNPTTFAKLAIQEAGAIDKVEERYRDLFLVMLNTIFTGEVAGEVFNGLGKTDILVRSRDRNVFIGECKFWTGPSDFLKAVDQLLGYPAWRDTKAGLLLFIRNRDVRAAIAKAGNALTEHPNFIRSGRHRNDLRHDAILRSGTDPDQRINIALLPFAIPQR